MATRTGFESALDRPVFSTTDKSYSLERLTSPNESGEPHGTPSKDHGRSRSRRPLCDRIGFRRGDRPTDRGQCGAIVEADTGSIRLDAKLRPQAIQVHTHRLVFHSGVQRLKNVHPNREVSRSENILKIPTLPDVTTGVEIATKSILQTLRIVCLATNLNVS